MTTPTISVVMPVCNVERFLAEAIESILGQTFKDFEFIIVDFGSTDKSDAIASKYAAGDSRIKLLKIASCFLPKARNAGASRAQGQYLAVMDADDVSLPQRFALQVEFLNQHPDIAAVGGAIKWIDSNGRGLVEWPNPVSDDVIRTELLDRCPIAQPSVMLRREAFSEVGGYRPFPAEDYDLWLRMSERFKLANLEQVILNYRVHPYQNSVRKRNRQTMGRLAHKASAAARKRGDVDPLNSVDEITPELLSRLGITEREQQVAFATAQLQWIRNLCTAGEPSAALKAAVDMLQASEWEHAPRIVTDVRILAAQLYWKQRKMLKCATVAGQAIWARPVVLGRPLRPLLRWAGWRSSVDNSA